MTDDTKTPAPAVVPNAPAVESPAQRPEVDLSDLQAELDATSQKAAEDEVFDEIAGKGKDAESESDEDEEEASEDADADEESDEGEEDDEDEEAEKPRKKPRHKRYRDQITRLEAENAQLRSRVSGSLTKAQLDEHVLGIVGPEPQESDFDNYLEFEHEHTAWLLDKRQASREVVKAVKAEQQARADRMADNVERHQERVEEFRNRNGDQSATDYDKVMASAKDLKVSPTVEELILESPKSAHLQYFFARNPERLDKINRMGSTQAAREIGHIEARLSLPQPKVKTAAPPPKRAPKGGAAPTSQEAELNAWLKRKYG